MSKDDEKMTIDDFNEMTKNFSKLVSLSKGDSDSAYYFADTTIKYFKKIKKTQEIKENNKTVVVKKRLEILVKNIKFCPYEYYGIVKTKCDGTNCSECIKYWLSGEY